MPVMQRVILAAIMAGTLSLGWGWNGASPYLVTSPLFAPAPTVSQTPTQYQPANGAYLYYDER